MPDLSKTNTMDTFSANSLKLLDKNVEEFKLKYIENLYFTPDNIQAKAGQNLHSFLCFYLKDFNTSKIENSLSNKDKEFIEKIKNINEIKTLKTADNKLIEHSFFVKCNNDNVFYLTGRFDAVLIDNDKIKIYDWKTLNLPKDPKNDLQTVVYLYCASKLFKSNNISITYISLTKNESIEVEFDLNFDYYKRVFDIIQKLF